MAFIKRTFALLEPQPVLVRTVLKRDTPTARGASFHRARCAPEMI